MRGLIWGVLLTSVLSAQARSSENRNACPTDLHPPLKRTLIVSGAFNAKRGHYGSDYQSDGDDVLAVREGRISAVRFDLHPLKRVNGRTGLKVQGFGTYVVINHADGSQSLYAHLARNSIQSLEAGQVVKAGDKIGVSDSSGAVTGPHLHFQFSPTGNLFKHEGVIDPDPCVLRKDWLTLESSPFDADGVGQLYVNGQLVGANVVHQKTRFEVPLRPGKYAVRVVAKQVKRYHAAYFSVEMGEAFTILDSQGGDIGPGFAEEMGQGTEYSTTLEVK